MRLSIDKSLPEEELIQACKKQHSRSQRTVYEKYSPKMFATCIRYIKDESEAEQTMIEGFMKVFSKIEQFTGQGSFEGWVRRIMVNECLGYLRKNKNMYLEVDIDKADYQIQYGKLEDNLQAEDLLKLIKELPMGYRTVFNLYAIEGYSHKEIAETLGVNTNTSKSQLSRARSLLQKKLAQIDQEIQRNSIIS